MTPEIIFTYSRIYEGALNGEIFKKKRESLSEVKILNYIKSIEKAWKRDEKDILREISKVTGLNWEEKHIYCYLIEKGTSFCPPLTMPMIKDKVLFMDLLTHELVHGIFNFPPDNFKKSKKAWDYINKKYRKESRKTRIHILVHAVHNYILNKLYDKKRLKKNIQFLSSQIDYKRAWDIVQKEGYQNILREMRKRIK